MKIINLIAENIKKLTAIDITPSDNLIMVTGPNGAGKSSILDCIVMALCGKSAVPAMPIKKGADKGKIVIDAGEFTVIRTFTKEGSYLKIEYNDDRSKVGPVPSPQKFLDKIVGNISFDPLDFLNNEKLKQRNILLTLLGVNVDELDKREREIREKRTIVGRDVEKYRAVWQTSPAYPEIKETEEVSVATLSAKLQKAIEANSAIETEKAANENLKTMAKKDLDRVTEIDAQIAALTAEKDKLNASVSERKAQYLATRDRLATATIIDTACIQEEISIVEQTNSKIRANAKKSESKAEFDTARETYDSYTKDIEAIAQERVDILANATMPVEGLSFDDTGLLYKGVPLDQASDGEKLMVSLGISMALNPTLRVLRIKDGSLLDSKNRAIIASMIKEQDYQLWFESVGSDGKVGILIEEGEIVAVDGEPVKAKGKTKGREKESVDRGYYITPEKTKDEEEW